MDINNPIPAEWESYVTQVNLGLEVIPSMMYSTAAFTSASTTVLPMFTTVSGANPALTNMTQPNMLGLPESFLIQAIRVFYHTQIQEDAGVGGAGAPLLGQINNVIQLSRLGILELKIGNKQYGPWPLWTLAAGNYAQGLIGSTGTSAGPVYGSYAQVGGPMYSLFPNLMIAPLQPFTCTLTWPAGAVTLTPAGASPMNIEVVFDGQRARSIQ